MSELFYLSQKFSLYFVLNHQTVLSIEISAILQNEIGMMEFVKCRVLDPSRLVDHECD